MTSTAGMIFEGFRLQRQLGEGWLGTVYVAQSLDNGQVVGLKIINSELVAQTQVIDQFRRLYTKWEHLNHANVLLPGRLIEHEQHVLYTMPLAANGSLRHLMQAHVRAGELVDQLVAIDIIRQAADAIAYAHLQNLVHGNLKPENLLLTPAKAIMGRRAYSTLVSDFGVAELQAFTHGTHDRQIISAPAYMAPEQFKGNRNDPRSDIYSLGVIFYELLTNLLPFETHDVASAADKHLHVAPIPPGQIRLDIPENVQEVVLTCMAKSPEYRYRTMGDLEEALQACLNELLPRGPRPTVVLPDLPEPPVPNIEPLIDRTPYHRIQICDNTGHLLRIEAVRDEQITLGRAPTNKIVLEHAGVSRHHLSLQLRDSQLFVTDLGSTNGTTIQGTPVAPRSEALWTDGTVMRIEPFWLRLQPPQRVVQQARIGVMVDENDIELTPGTLFSLPLQLANTGQTVDHFRIEVDGVPENWVQNLYTEVQLNPSMTTTLNLRILVPPKQENVAQIYPMRIIARSTENPEEIGYVPMNWTVRPFYDTEVVFKPQRRSAWRRTNYQFLLRNTSNAPLTYRPTMEDEEGEVKLQAPWDQIHLPTGGTSLRNVVPVRTIILNTFMRLREGIGKVRVLGLPDEITLAPGEEFRQRLDVRLPIRWIATSKLRKLSFDPHPSAGIDRPKSLTLNHLPLIPLWALPLLALTAAGFGYWMFLPPKVEVVLDPVKPKPGQPFNIKFNTENTTRLDIKPFNKTIYNTSKPLLITQGILNTTQIQVIAHGRIKTTVKALTINVDYLAPEIKTFTVDPSNITPGQQATVKWDVAGVKTLQLDPFGTVAAQGEKKVIISKDTTFTLAAKNQGGILNQVRAVKILPSTVDFFDVVPSQADIGQTVKIRWRVLNGKSVEIDPLGTVAAKGDVSWTVKGNQAFTMKVDNAGEPQVITKNLAIYPPQIDEFTVTPRDAKVGQTVMVHWKTSHASNVNINPLGTVPASGDQPYRINTTNTMFTISAGNGQTSATPQQVAVNAMTLPPEIQLAQVSPSTAKPGQQITLNWQTNHAVSVDLSGMPQGNISLPASGQINLVAPSAKTSLIFTAKASDGTVAVKTVDLNIISKATPSGTAKKEAETVSSAVKNGQGVGPAAVAPVAKPSAAVQPAIYQFGANTSNIQEGNSTHLHWMTIGVQHVKLFPGGAIYPPSKSISVQPKVTTTYTLLAGSQRQTITITVTPRLTTPSAPTAGTQASGAMKSSNLTSGGKTPDQTITGQYPAAKIIVPPTPKQTTADQGSEFKPVAQKPLAPSPVPQVTTVALLKTQIQQGQSTMLSWKATGISNVTVLPQGKVLPATGSILVSPKITTTYTIQAGSTTKKVTLMVQAPPNKPTISPSPRTQPTIVYFNSDDIGLLAGSRGTTLRWEAKGVQNVRLMPDNKVLPAQGSVLVKPMQTATYTLIAGGLSKSVTVKVFGSSSAANGSTPVTVPAAPGTNASTSNGNPQGGDPNNEKNDPKIVRFDVSPNLVTPGEKVTLTWEVANSTSVYITPLGLTDPHQDPSGSIERTIYRTTVFKIDVHGKGKTVKGTATVLVKANPNAQGDNGQ